jgi:glucose/arabinose dehydrogenase
VVLGGANAAAARQTFESGFADAPVTALPAPTAIAFTPDGRLLITTQAGLLRLYDNGVLSATAALDLRAVLCADSERGLLGVAVDPAFGSNRYIYLYYTFKKHGVCERNTARAPVNRVSRFVLADTGVVDRASETILVDNIPSPNGNHNAGDIAFGRDGYLYISVGDGGCDYLGDSGCAGANDAARDAHVLLGKILRITRDGGIPPTNPFLGASSVRCAATGRAQPGQTCQETFASGLRNPFRMAFDPNAFGTRFFINDVGQNAWEEIDLGKAAADYGWNRREGFCANGSTTDCGTAPAGLTNPIHAYAHSTGCSSITGGAFVPNGWWPATYDNAYLFSDYVCGRMFILRQQTDGSYTRTTFASGLGASSAVAMAFGPAESGGIALYYTTYAGGGQVRRITYQANAAPRAAFSATPLSGAVPLTVRFDGSASNDPDGDAITYEWSFGDGSAPATGAIVSHTYNTAGSYTARLTVRDPKGGTGASTISIAAGNRPPQPAITSPSATARFSVGQTVTLQGSATDPEDGTLAGSRLSWRVTLHHGSHTHPFVPATAGATITFQAPAPEDLAATTNSYLEISLTAMDSGGLSATVSQSFQPRLVNVTVASQPPGLSLVVNGSPMTTPRQFTSWQGYQLRLSAPDQSDSTGARQVFTAWSDAGASEHVVTTPSAAPTYTATFQRGVRLAPSADTFVRGGTYASRNFGTLSALETKLSGPEYTRQAYLTFDATSAPATIGSARLRVYGAMTGTATMPTAVAGVRADAWSETTLTWNTRPPSTAAIATTDVVNTSSRWYEFDVTPYVRAEKAAGRHRISLMLSTSVSTSPFGRFNSREAASNRPELLIVEPGARDIVLHAADATTIAGTWSRIADTSAASGIRVGQTDAARPKVLQASQAPADYFELTFDAEAGRPYRLWMRGQAASNYWGNDSAYVQFSGSVTASGAPVYRIGSTSAAEYILEDCNGCGLAGWGWQDNGYGAGVLGPEIYFATTGPQVIRIQTREDGLSIDQIVLSPSTYRATAPGHLKLDTTILPKGDTQLFTDSGHSVDPAVSTFCETLSVPD